MKRNQIMFDVPDDTNGGALEVLGPVDVESASEEVVEETTPVTVTSPPFDPRALATEFGQVLRETVGAGQPPQQQITPEEARKLLRVFDIKPEFLAKFDNLDTRQAALEEFRDGLVTQSMTIAQRMFIEALQEQEQRYAPVMQMVQRMEAEQMEKEFATTYPQLASPKLKPLIFAVANQLKSQGKVYQERAAMFKDVAENVTAVVQETNPEFKLSAGSPPAKQQTPVGGIPVTTPGAGGGGGGGSKSTTQTGPKALGILGKVKG